MRRTLMHRDVELLDFEADPVTGDARVVDETEAGRNLIASMKMDGNKAIDRLLKSRTISHFRKDLPLILESYHAHSRIELALMGHGLSVTDMFWYRLPNSSDRWADINLLDNEWDPGFGAAILSKDYAGLARCSLDVPDVTTPGHAAKAWERNDEGIFLVKAAERPDGADAQGVKLCSDLCAALFDEGDYVPVRIVKRYGRICSASPLMLSRSEELVNGYWLHVIPSAQGTPDVVIAPNDSGTPNVPSNCEGRNGTLYQKWMIASALIRLSGLRTLLRTWPRWRAARAWLSWQISIQAISESFAMPIRARCVRRPSSTTTARSAFRAISGRLQFYARARFTL